MQAAIEVRAIGQRAASGTITLRDVSLTVGHGELVSIIGGSGSGKTTLLDAMSGLRPPSWGTVLRDPQAPGGKRDIGYVPNDEAIHHVLPLGRALRYMAALRGMRVADGALEGALRVAALRGKAAVLVGELNPGERKRAAIAAELLSPPALMFLEEPTLGLDPAQGAEVMRLLDRLRNAGTTVVLTTQNPLDAIRCDKVAVLATGGHLAFFGTPDAARGYFAADSLDEIYERLAGLGDPAATWARRFCHFSPPSGGYLAYRPETPYPSPASLVPDPAGLPSAGRPHTALFPDYAALADPELPGDSQPPVLEAAAPGGITAWPARDGGMAVAALRALRQLAVLTARSGDVLRRDRYALALLAGVPLAVTAALLLLVLPGALGPSGTTVVALSWTLLGGFSIGLAYGLPQIHREIGVLRADRFAGLGATAYVLARAVILLPVVAAADVIILLVPLLSGRLHEGFGPTFLSLVLTSATGFALALVLSAIAAAQPRTLRAPAAPVIPVAPLAAALFTLLHRQFWGDWLVLAVIAMALMAVTVILITRIAPLGRG